MSRVGTSRCDVPARVIAGGRKPAARTAQRAVPTIDIALLTGTDILAEMEVPHRKRLPHDVPLWVDPQKEIYFITINCAARGSNQLALPELAEPLFATVAHRQQKELCWPHLFLLMPDHVHALITFPPMSRPLKSIISKWKEWTAKQLGIQWQRDFFEHRLRREESRREKADYILNNPLRKGLVRRPEEWSYVYFADSKPPQFER
jgi:putative transposase